MENHFEHTFFPLTTVMSGVGQEVLPDLYCLPVQIVNVVFARHPGPHGEWTLVDAGMPTSHKKLLHAAEERFGTKPAAIILTHGHFDHVGALVQLVREWNVPVYAHELELPYLTGQANYPPGDPAVDGGLVAKLSPLFPNDGIDLDGHVSALPADGTVPGMAGWRWVHTPGHTPGHVSLFREADRALIAGDAFVTVRQESLYSVVVQEQEMSGPPKYFTTDWQAAGDSVKKLEALKPSVAVTGHGTPMSGERLASDLSELARDFERIAIPAKGRYVH